MITDANEEIPYWKNYQANVVRGVIAAICCAAFFITIGLVHKFRWRPENVSTSNGGSHAVTYKKEDDGVDIHADGQDNPAMQSEE